MWKIIAPSRRRRRLRAVDSLVGRGAGGGENASMASRWLRLDAIDATVVAQRDSHPTPSTRHRRCHAGGRANIWSTLKKAGLVREHEDATDLGQAKWRERSAAILERVKRLENLGYSFEGAEASVHLMLLHASPGYCSPFTVLDYSVTTSDENLDSASRAVAKGGRHTAQRARATVKVRIADGDDEDRLDVAEGSGPVDALAAALVRSLAPTFPFVNSIRLVDYKVRILDPHSATRAATRVECTFKEKITGKVWTTVSVDRNVISASANALVDGFEFGIVEYADSCMLCEVDYDAPPIYSSDDEASSSVQAMPREVRTAR